ncbi:MAG TPA: chorismate mutase [Longimicrobiales bacterium]|nr:chorismate mutase [Longimicrobiales bacterium]
MNTLATTTVQEQTVSIDETRMEHVQELRAEIARADQEIVGLLARRIALVRKLGGEKERCGLATADPAREAAVLRSVAASARVAGLDEERVRELFWCVIEMSRSVQLRDSNS